MRLTTQGNLSPKPCEMAIFRIAFACFATSEDLYHMGARSQQADSGPNRKVPLLHMLHAPARHATWILFRSWWPIGILLGLKAPGMRELPGFQQLNVGLPVRPPRVLSISSDCHGKRPPGQSHRAHSRCAACHIESTQGPRGSRRLQRSTSSSSAFTTGSAAKPRPRASFPALPRPSSASS